ncbi:MAG: zinc ribbon domain-containing protein [Acidobacteriia bacterium]|nr:zinc ribbon domain-containing protein [Terriglobia bacterium]
MFCDRCGAKVQEGHAFCPACGKSIGTVPMMPVQGRIEGHVRLVGIFWLALSALRLVGGFAVLTIFGEGLHTLARGVPGFVNDIMQTVGGVLLAFGVLGIIAGWGLLERQRWARMLAIVLGCFGLLDVGLGTALGVYTLWVLLPAKSEREYNQIARVA